MAMLVLDGRQCEFESECVLGRHRECGFVVHDAAASRRHCRVLLVDGVWWAEDLGSANGTRHNGERFEGRRRLVNGDAIRIGDAEIMFFAPEAAAGAKKTMIDPASLEGREISGYRIGQIVGRGGMGLIYRARQLSLDRDVAFKVFTRQVVADDPGFAARFAELAGRAGSLRHDGLVQIHENGTDDGLVWYTMDLVEGDTVERLLEREQRFDPVLALLIAERMALTLAEAHAAGVIHRDLSPAAVILTPEGRVKILDIGIAAILGRGRDRTRPRAAWYQSPEVAERKDPHPADDAYALGCILFHMLAGRPPFDGATLDAVRTQHRESEIPQLASAAPGVPARIGELIAQLLTKNRDWRMVDMAALAKELRTQRDAIGAKAEAAAGMAGRIVHVRKPAQAEALKSHLVRWSVVLLLVVAVVALVPTFLTRTTVASTVPPPPEVKNVPTFAPPKQPFGQAPPPVQVVTPADPDAPAVDWPARWRAVREAAIGRARAGEWNAAELPLAELAGEAGLPVGIAEQIRITRGQLAADAEAWYQRQIAALPPGDDPRASATRLTALARLRDQAPQASRPDAEARWQESLTLLAQQLAEASRRARQAIERGRPEDLPRIAEDLAPAVSGTPLAGLHRQFADLLAEAAQVRALWNKDWPTTVSAFDRLRGERLLPAAAALLVVGDTARAKRMLADPALNAGALLRRREAVQGRSAALLSFDDPSDLRFIELAAGEPVLAGGALAGKAGDPATLACTIPVGGADWQAEVAFQLAGASGEAVLTCALSGEQSLLVRVAGGECVLRGGGQERKLALPTAGAHRLRASCRGGELLVVVDGQTVIRLERSPVAAGSQAKLDFAGADWSLEDLIVVGGG